MLANTLHTKWVTQFLVLLYLLITVTTANGSFWCQESGNPSHLESNPAGECWDLSPSEEDKPVCCEEIITPGVFLSVQEEDCFDSPAYSSILTRSNRTSPLSKISITDTVSIAQPFNPSTDSGIARFANLTPASQLPPPQALTVLRTVILLQ